MLFVDSEILSNAEIIHYFYFPPFFGRWLPGPKLLARMNARDVTRIKAYDVTLPKKSLLPFYTDEGGR